MPLLSVERTSRSCGLPADKPTAVAEPVGQSQRVVSCCRLALAGGVRPGRTVAEARAVLPELAVCPHDPQADRRRLGQLAAGAMQFSPIVQPVEPGVLLLDVTGCERLFGGERRLGGLGIRYVEREGFSVRGAIAGTMGAAWALAHAGGERLAVVEPEGEVAALAGLPAWSLRIEPDAVAALDRLGVATVDDLLHLPRSSLAGRFGRSVLRRLDQAVGAMDEPVEPFRPAELPAVRMSLAFPTDRQEVVHAGVESLLGRLTQRLEQQGQGAAELVCTFYREQARPIVSQLWLSRPTRALGHLTSLLAEKVRGLDLSVPVSAISLHVVRAGVVPRRQGRLFESAEVSDPQKAAGLLDELSNRLGQRAVVRALPGDDHQPEHACRYEPVTGGRDIRDASGEALAGKPPVAPRKSNRRIKHDVKRRVVFDGAFVPSSGRGAQTKEPARRSNRVARDENEHAHAENVGVSPVARSEGSDEAKVVSAREAWACHPTTEHWRASRQWHPIKTSEGLSPTLRCAKDGAPSHPDRSSEVRMAAGERPVRLFARPQPIDVIAGANDGGPAWFRWRGDRRRVARAVGPERIETGWWRGRQVCRDYYVVQDQEGGRFWMFRDRESRRWYLHGCFE